MAPPETNLELEDEEGKEMISVTKSISDNTRDEDEDDNHDDNEQTMVLPTAFIVFLCFCF